MRRSLPLLAPVLLTLLLSSVAPAAVVLRLSLKDLAELADVVVRGRVESAEARWERGRIFTVVRLVARTVYKGRVKRGQPVEVKVPGGEVGDLGQWVPGAPTVTVGEDVVLFLEDRPIGRVVVGLGLGWLRTEGEPGGVQWGVREDHPELGPGLRVPLERLAGTVAASVRP